VILESGKHARGVIVCALGNWHNCAQAADATVQNHISKRRR